MATHKSAEKRARQNEKRRLRNKAVQTGLKRGIKSVRQAIEAKDPEAAAQTLTQVAPAIDKAASKGVIHRKTASRKISRLAKAVASLSDQS